MLFVQDGEPQTSARRDLSKHALAYTPRTFPMDTPLWTLKSKATESLRRSCFLLYTVLHLYTLRKPRRLLFILAIV